MPDHHTSGSTPPPLAADESHTDTIEETWAYAGRRLMRSGKGVHAWATEAGHGRLVLFAGRGTYALGALYHATVERTGDGVTLYGTPRFAEPGDLESELVADWQAAHHAAQVRAATARQERKAAQRDEMAAHLDPLRLLVNGAATRADRAALIAHILAELTRPQPPPAVSSRMRHDTGSPPR